MRLVAGIDPGQKGAIALLDAVSGRVQFVVPMPMGVLTINKKPRKRLDIGALDRLLHMLVGLETELVCVENVGAGFGSGGRELGEACGIIKALCYKAELRTDFITASAWKQKMKCPADKKEAFYRAEALFPKDREMFRGPKGGMEDGRAEAAMIALYGAQNRLNNAA